MVAISSPQADPSAPTVSIVTRTVSRPELLRRAIETVLAQTYTHWQHVIVNEGGDPAALEAITGAFTAAYAGRLLLIHHPHSRGRAAAANAGIAAASGSLIVLLDDDDSWSPRFLSSAVAALLRQSGTFSTIRAIACQTDMVEERVTDGRMVTVKVRPFGRQLGDGVVSLDELFFAANFTTNAFLFERAVWEEIGRFDESLDAHEDWEFAIRYALRYDIAILPERLANYHLRPQEHGRFGNSVIAEAGQARMTAQRLRNAWLRRDLNAGHFGPGVYMNLRLHVQDLLHNTGMIGAIRSRLSAFARRR